MDKSRILKTIVIPVLVGVLATVMVAWYIRTEEKRLSPADMIPVLIASRPIPAKTVLLQDMLKVKSVPRSYAPPNALQQPDQAIGRATVVALAEGEPVVAARLATNERLLGLSHYIPAGMRAMTVAVNEVMGVAAFPEPGDRVDILSTFTKEMGGRDRTDMIVEDVPVLAVVRDTESKGGQYQKDLRQYTSLTIAVTPQQAATLAWSEERGKLRVLLRPNGAKDRAAGVQANSQSVLGYSTTTTPATSGR